MLGLIWAQTGCNGYQHRTLVGKEFTSFWGAQCLSGRVLDWKPILTIVFALCVLLQARQLHKVDLA